MTSRYQIGNAQTIGCREVQSNYFSTAYNDSGDLFTVLADGTIDHPNGRRAAIMCAGYCVDTFLRSKHGTYTKQFMFEAALKANRYIKDTIYIGKSPRLSLTMALFAGKELLCFNVGANKVCLYNMHGERSLCDNANSSYASVACELLPRSVIGIFSAGAHTVSHPMERIKIIEAQGKIFDKAQALIESVERKSLNNQLNATALLVEVIK